MFACRPALDCLDRVPTAEEWSTFMEAFHGCTGVDLTLYKAPQLQRRLQEMMLRHGDQTLPIFWDRISKTVGGTAAVMDALAINVTEMYRDPTKWIELKERVLPDLLKRSECLNCWSAGCSFGAEAHTLAIILDVHHPGRHRIIGTDIDATALNQAVRGEFEERQMERVPEEVRNAYFEYQEKSRVWKAGENIRKYLEFRRGNVLADPFEDGFDLIMCRNVVIYFTETAKDALYRRFYAALKPGGVLFVGSSERILNAEEIGFEATIPFFYRRPMIG